MLGSGSGGMRGRNGRVCRVQNVPRQNTLKRGLRTGVRKPVTFTILSIILQLVISDRIAMLFALSCNQCTTSAVWATEVGTPHSLARALSS